MLNLNLINYVSVDKKDWGEHLNMAEFCYNSTLHSMTKMSPIQINIGKRNQEADGLSHSHGAKCHWKEAMEVKGHEEKYARI